MTTLGGYTLSDHLLLLGLDEAPAQTISQSRTLGGRLVLTMLPLESGRELSLQSENHITNADLIAIRALYDAGQIVALVHPRLSAEVIITGIDLTPDQDFVNPSATGAAPWYSGTISLIEV